MARSTSARTAATEVASASKRGSSLQPQDRRHRRRGGRERHEVHGYANRLTAPNWSMVISERRGGKIREVGFDDCGERHRAAAEEDGVRVVLEDAHSAVESCGVAFERGCEAAVRPAVRIVEGMP